MGRVMEICTAFFIAKSSSFSLRQGNIAYRHLGVGVVQALLWTCTFPLLRSEHFLSYRRWSHPLRRLDNRPHVCFFTCRMASPVLSFSWGLGISGFRHRLAFCFDRVQSRLDIKLSRDKSVRGILPQQQPSLHISVRLSVVLMIFLFTFAFLLAFDARVH